MVNFNQQGSLLEELAELDPPEHKVRLFEVIGDIRSVIVGLYTDTKGVEKLEDQIANHESWPRGELTVLSEGVKGGLRRSLDRNQGYDRDTVNQVFIALYRHLIGELGKNTLDSVVDYDRGDNMNEELAGVVRQLNIYHVLSSWVTENNRSIDGLEQDEMRQATREFRDLKKSSRSFVIDIRTLLRRGYNIESGYDLFERNKTLETYDDIRRLMDSTIMDCRRLIRESTSGLEIGGTSVIRNFAEVTMLNAEFYLLQMGYEMLHNEAARSTIPEPEKFQSELRDAVSDRSKIRYFSIMPNSEISIDPSIKKLAPEVRAFYQGELK